MSGKKLSFVGKLIAVFTEKNQDALSLIMTSIKTGQPLYSFKNKKDLSRAYKLVNTAVGKIQMVGADKSGTIKRITRYTNMTESGYEKTLSFIDDFRNKTPKTRIINLFGNKVRNFITNGGNSTDAVFVSYLPGSAVPLAKNNHFDLKTAVVLDFHDKINRCVGQINLISHPTPSVKIDNIDPSVLKSPDKTQQVIKSIYGHFTDGLKI